MLVLKLAELPRLRDIEEALAGARRGQRPRRPPRPRARAGAGPRIVSLVSVEPEPEPEEPRRRGARRRAAIR